MDERFVVSVVKGKDVQKMVEEAVRKIGGIKSVVSPGSRVLVKPNLLKPTQNLGVTTNPKVTEAVINLIKKAKPKEIIIAESSEVNKDTAESFEVSGTKAVAERTGVKFVDLKKDQIVEIKIPKGRALKELRVPETVINCDVLINVPVMKTHIQTGVSLSMKNLKGFLPDEEKKRVHLMDLEQAIVDFNSVFKTDLVVMDATTALEGLGPNSPPGKPVPMDLIIAGRNRLAVDMVATAIMGFEPKTLRFIRKAVAAGFGPRKIDDIEILGPRIEEVKRAFERPPKELEPLPGVKLIVGSPCSSCIGEYSYGVFRLKSLGTLEKIKDKMNGLTIAIGPKAKDMIPKEARKNILLLGNCLEGICDEGAHAKGCPPFFYDSIAALYGEKRLEEVVK
ncbi:MAG TPA: DUF362 domain-containing protein [Candidatus Bathyarchaeia archaeon]|nr:DUF362 domain-containing protein [Candidatus Bathyarchaeia archaeon]